MRREAPVVVRFRYDNLNRDGVGTKGLEVRWKTALHLEGENDEEVRRVYRDVWERMTEEREAARDEPEKTWRGSRMGLGEWRRLVAADRRTSRGARGECGTLLCSCFPDEITHGRARGSSMMYLAF